MRSAREPRRGHDIRMTSRSEHNRSTGFTSVPRERDRSGESGKKEQAPIIITKDEQFLYKAPSSIHETVVNTLRKEKDGLAHALQNQREMTNSIGARVTSMNVRMQDLEATNERLLMIQDEDKNALVQLD